MKVFSRLALTSAPAQIDSFKVGDILCCEWGYSMQLVDFYKVIKVSGSSVQLQALENKFTSKDEWGQSGKVIPSNKVKKDADVDGKRFLIHLAGDRGFPKDYGPWIKINSSKYPVIKWDGKPKTWDTYD